MKNVTVATFDSLAPAQSLKARLVASHIHAEVRDQSRHERLWFVRKPRAGVRLMVPPVEFEPALNLLHAWDAMDGALHDAVRCPECGSSRVEYPQSTRKFLLPNFVALFSALHLVEKEHYCEDCHYTWMVRTKPPRPRAHQAPYYFIEGIDDGQKKNRLQ